MHLRNVFDLVDTMFKSDNLNMQRSPHYESMVDINFFHVFQNSTFDIQYIK